MTISHKQQIVQSEATIEALIHYVKPHENPPNFSTISIFSKMITDDGNPYFAGYGFKG
jgi:hypothetical protein